MLKFYFVRALRNRRSAKMFDSIHLRSTMENFNKLLLFMLLAYLGFACNSGQAPDQPAQESTATEATEEAPAEGGSVVLFFGNSLTAAYGLDPAQGFTGLIQQRVDSLGWPVQVVNAGVTGETTASGESRVDWVLKRQEVDVFVLELGANDGLRGIPVTETEQNLRSMIAKVRQYQQDADIILAGMMVPPNMGSEYSERFQAVFPRVAAEEEVSLIPFLLEGVAGESTLNLEDGIHPNPEGHKIVAENIWTILEPVLRERGVAAPN